MTDIHITNNSTEFVNQIPKELYSRCNVAHHITSPYHLAVNGLMERLNRTMTEMMIKGLDQQENWPDFVKTCVWNIPSNVHKSTNYQPIHLLIGRRPKMPPECINYTTDIKDTANFTDREVKMVVDGVSNENLKFLIGIRKDILHPNAHLNMKKSSARQKKNYDLKNATPMKLAVGDLVLKIKQKNLSRQGGRLDNRTEEQLFCVESIMSNGNLKLIGEKSKEMYPHSIPLSRVKRFLLKKRSCPSSPKYVKTNPKVPKTATNSTIAISSPSAASGSPSTSKFVTCNTTLTSLKNVQMNAKVPNTATNPSASVSIYIQFCPTQYNSYIPKKCRDECHSTEYSYKLHHCHFVSMCIWISIYIQICCMQYNSYTTYWTSYTN